MFFQCKKYKYVHTNVGSTSQKSLQKKNIQVFVHHRLPPLWRDVCCCSLAGMCHSFHYIKRILETMFVHRISHGTMPLRNIFKVSCFFFFFFHASDLWVGRLRVLRYHFVFIVRNLELICVAAALSWTLSLIIVPPSKNCGYYWCSAAWMAYYINHPLYTTPSKWWLLRFSLITSQCWLSRSRPLTLAVCLTVYGEQQVKAGLYIFLVSSTSVPLVIYSASLNTREPLKGISTIRWPLCEFVTFVRLRSIDIFPQFHVGL